MFLIYWVIAAYLEVSSEQLCIYFAKLPEFSAPSSLSKGVDCRQWSVDVDHYLPNNGSKPVLMTARINGTKHWWLVQVAEFDRMLSYHLREI